MAHLFLLARYFPKPVNVTKTAIIQGLMVYAREKFVRNETKCDKTEQLLSQAQQMSQILERKPTCYHENSHQDTKTQSNTKGFIINESFVPSCLCGK